MKEILTNNAPTPIGLYAQAIMLGNLLFISGQIAINPITNEFVSGSIEDETKMVLRNLEAILNEANMNFNKVIKSEIYLINLSDFSKVNEIYEQKFTNDVKHSRVTIGVLSLPKGAKIEISMIAERKNK